jgi:hypothetical protein
MITQAFVASVLLNVVTIAAGLSGGAQGRSTLLTRLSDFVAAPPGIIITHCCTPDQHTGKAFFSSVLEATGISILFYGLAAWLILEAVYWSKRTRAAGTSSQ